MPDIIRPNLTKVLLVLLITSILVSDKGHLPIPARAAAGMPDSAEFGYGARLDIWGEEVEMAIFTAADIGVEWIGLEFDWARHWPDASSPINLNRLDQVMAWLDAQNLRVMLSIFNTPDWALGPTGPNSNQTAGLAVMLAKRYPATLLAIELFPAANTAQGWGAPPNPPAYAQMLKTSRAALQASGTSIVPVAGGLSPVSAQAFTSDIDDLEFLNGLYQAGAASSMPIIGLRLNQLEGEALDPPGLTSLRRYEAIRQTMLQFNHSDGLIWITGFRWPKLGESGAMDEQICWLNQAYQLMRSQLYIGVAFFDQLNPPENSKASLSIRHSLIVVDPNGAYSHPVLQAIGQIISLNRDGRSSFQLFLHKQLSSGGNKRSLKPRGP